MVPTVSEAWIYNDTCPRAFSVIEMSLPSLSEYRSLLSKFQGFSNHDVGAVVLATSFVSFRCVGLGYRFSQFMLGILFVASPL